MDENWKRMERDKRMESLCACNIHADEVMEWFKPLGRGDPRWVRKGVKIRLWGKIATQKFTTTKFLYSKSSMNYMKQNILFIA